MKHQGGFVLATVLVVLAVITVGATFIAVWVQSLRANAQVLQNQTQSSLDIQSTKATLLYLVSTQGMTYGGLRSDGSSGISKKPEDMGAFNTAPIGNEIKLDDAPYSGVGNTFFSIQDEGGLLNVNYFSPAEMYKLLGYVGIAMPQATSMTNKLLDFTDSDNVTRMHGAERLNYAQAGLDAPANRPLVNPQEAYRVMEWAGATQLWRYGLFQRYTTVQSRGYPNVNTAPLAVLMTMDGLTERSASLLISAREKQVITLADQVAQITAGKINVPFDNINRFTSRYLRLSIWDKDGGVMKQIHLELTPKSPTHLKPWLIEYENEVQVWPELINVAPSTLEGSLAKALLSPD